MRTSIKGSLILILVVFGYFRLLLRVLASVMLLELAEFESIHD
jgi:hypothetical protein